MSLRPWSGVLVLILSLAHAAAFAQAVPAKPKVPPRPAAAAKAASAPAAAPIAGPGWRVGARPAWVVDPPGLADLNPGPAPAGGAARRELLIDFQSDYALPKPQHFYRFRVTSTDASTLGPVSQTQIGFNPAFQNVVLHEASVTRDGRRSDRIGAARIELMRREQRLEQLAIDGTETLLVLLSDVRVGDIVEFAYTVEGENPIFDGHISTGVRLAWDTPIELLHYRLTAPAARPLQVRSIAGDFQPERLAEGGRQVLRLLRQKVAGIPSEQGTPPWFKSHPALLISEYANWGEVDAWARGLFALPPAPNPALAERVAAFRASGLAGEALAAEVLRFVQDEVRYFSVSLGESSHRPKPPQRTLAERLGDCKDKVVLLNALLTELGFDAKPALVSTVRNRGLVNFLPSHDEFDHVITRLDLNGRSYYLDATMTGQGLTLAGRGYYPYGSALVVGAGAELQPVAEPPDALNRLEFEQRWDYSQPGSGATLTTVMRAHGLTAERWRAGLAMGGEQRLAEAIAGAHTRMVPGLKSAGAAKFSDDRQNNRFELEQSFTLSEPARYSNGALDLDLSAFELADALIGPPESRRRTPYLIDQPRSVDSRIVVTGPRPVTFRPPAPTEVVDRHFRFSSRVDISGNQVVFVRRVERRSDEVLPADLESYRQNVLRARQMSGGRLRLALLDTQALAPDFQRLDRKLVAAKGYRRDALADIVLRNEVTRLLDTKTLEALPPNGPLAARVHASRALAANQLGDFGASLPDADAALALDPQLEDAIEARAVALLGAGQAEASLAEFRKLADTSRRAVALKWMGSVELHLGHAASAEKLVRDALDGSGGEDRDFVLLWLYLAAEQQGAGRGLAAITSHLDAADPKKLPGAMLHFLGGRLDRDAVIKVAREKPEMERLNLAEAYFYIGQQLLAQGQQDEARRWFTRVVETGAVPYREMTFAKLELARGK